MDDDSPVAGAGSALTRKLGPLPVWGWALAGGVILFLLSRGRGGGGPSQASAVSAEERQAQALLAQEQAKRSKQQGAIEEMQLAQAKREFDLAGLFADLQGYALKREIQTQKALLSREATARFQCPPGQGAVKRDPNTGRLYCRPKAGGGFNLGSVFTGILDVYKSSSGVLN